MRKRIGIISFILLIGLFSCQYENRFPQKELQSSQEVVARNIDARADTYLALGKIDSAIFILSNGLEKLDSISDSTAARLNIKLGSFWFENNNNKQSIFYLLNGINLIQPEKYITENTGLYTLYCMAHVLLANNYRIVIKYDSSLHFLNIAQNLNGNIHDLEDRMYAQAEVQYYNALVYYNIGDYNKSENYILKSIDLKNNIQWGDCIVLNNYLLLSEIYTYQKDFYKAEVVANKAMEITKACYSDSSIEYAIQLNTLGLLFYESETYEKAKGCFEKSKVIINSSNHNDSLFIGMIYNNLGDTYCKLALQNKGIDYYTKAIKIFTKNNNYKDLKIVFHNLGNVYTDMGCFYKAYNYYQKSLDLSIKTGTNKGVFTSYTFHKLGQLFLAQEEFKKALSYYDRAINQICSTNIDSVILDKQKLPRQIISEVKLIEYLYHRGAIEYSIYSRNNDLSFLSQANHSFLLATKLLDWVRNQFLTEESKIRINNIRSPLFSHYLLSLIEQNIEDNNPTLDNQIFECIERSKYTALRSMMDFNETIKNSNVPIRTIELADSLIKSIRILNSRINISESQKNLNSQVENNLRNSLFKHLFSYDSLMQIIESENNQFKEKKYSLKYYSINQIQNLLEDTSVILNYCITDSIILIYAISHENYSIHYAKTPADFLKKKNQMLKSIVFSNTANFELYSKRLYGLLIEPIEKYISSYKHLIIIPDDNCSDIPFEGLIIPSSKKSKTGLQEFHFLIEKFAISYNYSINLWYEKIEKSKNQEVIKYPLNFCGYAPIGEKSGGSKINNELMYSTLEIQEVANLFQSRKERTFVCIGPEVSKKNIALGLSNSKIFHIATHSYSNWENNEYYFQLYSDNSNLTNDIINDCSSINSMALDKLYLEEIYNMNISSELVIISSCCSGIGEKISGEGTVSLARGFYYSGAKNIIYSLWDVSDKHTKEFMLSFYKKIQQGNSYIHALQKTKIEFINSKNQLPTFWSSFIINS